jgi:acetyl esterase/lipase
MKPIRSPVPIHIKDVPIMYGENNHFKIRIYDPVDGSESSQGVRPALLTVHGGGWTQGSAESDDGIYLNFLLRYYKI